MWMLLFGDWCESHQRSLWQVFTIQGEKGKKTCCFSLCGSLLLFGSLANQAESDRTENSLSYSLFYGWWKGLSKRSTSGRVLAGLGRSYWHRNGQILCLFVCFFFFVFDFVFANEDGAITDFGCIGMYVKESAAIFGWSDHFRSGSNSPCWFSSICE